RRRRSCWRSASGGGRIAPSPAGTCGAPASAPGRQSPTRSSPPRNGAPDVLSSCRTSTRPFLFRPVGDGTLGPAGEDATMALTFYYGSGSPFAWRVWLALEHKHIPYTFKRMQFDNGDLHTPEYLAINPRHKVPAIVDDGFALYESAAIVEYLED